MKAIEALFNGMVRGLCFLLRIEPTTKGAQNVVRAREDALEKTLEYPSVKVLERDDGQERVRIVQRGENFGAVVDFFETRTGWRPASIVEGGFVFESPEFAEIQVRDSVPWLAPKVAKAEQAEN